MKDGLQKLKDLPKFLEEWVGRQRKAEANSSDGTPPIPPPSLQMRVRGGVFSLHPPHHPFLVLSRVKHKSEEDFFSYQPSLCFLILIWFHIYTPVLLWLNHTLPHTDTVLTGTVKS